MIALEQKQVSRANTLSESVETWQTVVVFFVQVPYLSQSIFPSLSHLHLLLPHSLPVPLASPSPSLPPCPNCISFILSHFLSQLHISPLPVFLPPRPSCIALTQSLPSLSQSTIISLPLLLLLHSANDTAMA